MKRDPLKDIQSSRGRELKGRRIVLCVTGSVASMETPSLARELMRHGAEVYPVMSEAAQKLLKADLLEWATGNPVIRSLTGKTEHVRLAGNWPGKADLVLVAPCTANTISKIALGIDDTPVTTFASMALGSKISLVVCPAAHEPMYRNQAVAENLAKLRTRGAEVVEPNVEEGKAKMANSSAIVAVVMRMLARKDLLGLNILVTGGPTAEFIDPVRVITNLSSGKMGLSLATEAWRRGAGVSYVYGGNLAPPSYIRSKKIVTTDEMLDQAVGAVGKEKFEMVMMAAAPADFTPEKKSPKKIPTRGGVITLRLRPTAKIVEAVRKAKPSTFIVAFKAETVNSIKELESRAKAFMKESRVDMVVANKVVRGNAFGSDYNEVLIISRGRRVFVPRATKEKIASRILDEALRAYRRR
jgi:phosphopantothenoylcysteine decarboxylase/phosphopantothenate--cysteine ligase